MQNQPPVPTTPSTATTSAPAATPAAAAPPPPAPQNTGRPTVCTNEFVSALCDIIRRRGLSDSAAAIRLGVPRNTLSDWKRKYPELALWLGRAREEFREA